MKFLTWNFRGCNVLEKWHLIKRGFDHAKEDIIYVQETKVEAKIEKTIFGVGQKWLGYFVDEVRESKGLGIM